MLQVSHDQMLIIMVLIHPVHFLIPRFILYTVSCRRYTSQWMRNVYASSFPELESLVTNVVEYAKGGPILSCIVQRAHLSWALFISIASVHAL